jgi:glycosyltransferase involved in cell wall biosynthesis
VRILTNVNVLAPVGGLEVNACQLSREIVSLGHSVDVVYVKDGELTEIFRSFCGSIVKVPATEIPFSRRGPFDLVKLGPALRAGRRIFPDLILVNQTFGLPWALTVAASTRAKVVCHLHNEPYPQDHSTFQRALLSALGRTTRHFVAVSDFLRDRAIEKGLRPEWVEVVRPGVEMNAYPAQTPELRRRARESLGVSQEGSVFLYLGRVDPGKGIEVLLGAWSELRMDPESATLLVVGSPFHAIDPERYVARLKALTSDYGVIFLPRRLDVVELLHAADVVVVPSLYGEPFGRVVIEAMATGCPVVASRTGGIPEILTGELEHFLFEPGNVPELASLMKHVGTWRETEPSLGRACRDHVQAHFSVEQSALAMLNYFTDVLTSVR